MRRARSPHSSPPAQTGAGRTDRSPAGGTGTAGDDGGGSVTAPQSLEAVCLAAEHANPVLRDYAEFRSAFSAFAEETALRDTMLTEQFMRGSVQLKQRCLRI